ncbi:uncharacterized protein LOC142546257 [Primulina tabacum]|uniref:uncharacterized protein LOC142546257 n=1 Tax=Primulina tabacum TaxID=48773 RepID=UPI003F5A9AA2
MAVRPVANIIHASSHLKSCFFPIVTYPKSPKFSSNNNIVQFLNHPFRFSGKINLIPILKASPGDIIPVKDDDEGGISLGTLKLPANTDLARFEALLFQWGNSLCQGADLPLPVPLKVDKIPGGARLGFISVKDGQPEVAVYIDCLVFRATEDSVFPLFRAIRNGPLKDEPPPGEPRIMISLLKALKKCVEIATD